MSAAPKVTSRMFWPIDEVKRRSDAHPSQADLRAAYDRLDAMKAEWVMVEERDDGQSLFSKAQRFTRADAAHLLLALDKQSNAAATDLSEAFKAFLETQDDVFFLVNMGRDGSIMMYSANRDGAYAFKAEVS